MEKSPLDAALEDAMLIHKQNVLTHKYMATEPQYSFPKVLKGKSMGSTDAEKNDSYINLANSENVHAEGMECTGTECKIKRKIKKSITTSPS
jgi:hypothetical protein